MQNIFKYIIISSLVFQASQTVVAQIYEKATPYTFYVNESAKTARKDKKEFKKNTIKLKKVDNEYENNRAKKVLKEECITCNKDYYGVGIDVSINIKRDGNLYQLEDGSKLWLLNIYSEDAYGMQFYFNEYELPPGAKLFIYNEEKYVLGAFTDKNNRPDKKFAIQAISGDSITIEYHEPNDIPFSGKLEIYKSIHIFKDVFYKKAKGNDGYAGYGTSADCNIDVGNSAASGIFYKEEFRAICRISAYDYNHQFVYYCSGSLINNIANAGLPGVRQHQPLVLTANHCLYWPNTGGANLNYAEYIFDFNYENYPDLGEPQPQSIQGATLITKWSESDYALFGLSTYPEDDYHVSYLGWDSRDNFIPNSTISIHHPQGDIKKIAVDDNSPTKVKLITNDPTGASGWHLGTGTPNTHWQTIFDKGLVEKGSSGSPLIDSSYPNHLIGQLTSGNLECTSNGQGPNGGKAWYGLLSYSWDNNDLNFHPLAKYLAGSEYAIRTSMNGRFPGPPSLDPGDPEACYYISKGYELFPSTVLGHFNYSEDCAGNCGISNSACNAEGWKRSHGRVVLDCIGNSRNNSHIVLEGEARIDLDKYHGSGIYKDYSFKKDKVYILTFRAATGTSIQFRSEHVYYESVDNFYIRLANDINAGPFNTCTVDPEKYQFVFFSNDQQVIFEKSDFKNPIKGYQSRWKTFAVKFIPEKDYSKIWIYNTVTGTQSLDLDAGYDEEALRIDDIFLFDGDEFENPCIEGCEENVIYSNPSNPLPSFTEASSSITASTTTIMANSNVTFHSKEIFLKPGFTVQNGAEFKAQIAPCLYMYPDPPSLPLETCTTSRLANNLSQQKKPISYNIIEYDLEALYNNTALKENNVYEDDTDFFVSPNPADNEISINGNFNESENVVLRIYDLMGTTIEEVNLGKQKNLEYKFRIDNIPNGIYYIELSTESKVVSKRVIINK